MLQHVCIGDVQLLAGHLELVVVADVGEGALEVGQQLFGREDGELLAGIEDEARAAFAVEGGKAVHVVHVARGDDGKVSLGEVREAVGGGLGHGAGIEAGDLIALEVGGDVAERGEHVVHDAHAVDPHPDPVQVLSVVREVAACAGHEQGFAAEQSQGVGDVARAAAAALGHAGDHEADVEHMELVHEHMVLEIAVEGHDAVEGEGA